MAALTEKDHYAKLVCHFLAEGLRTRKMNLKRVCEIAEKVVVHINLLDNEKDLLALIKELASDFEELIVLEEKIIERHSKIEQRLNEQMVKEFVILILPNDQKTAMAVLEDCSHHNATVEQLATKYPQFKDFKDKYVRQRI